jgi:hypothetical protein
MKRRRRTANLRHWCAQAAESASQRPACSGCSGATGYARGDRISFIRQGMSEPPNKRLDIAEFDAQQKLTGSPTPPDWFALATRHHCPLLLRVGRL